MNMDRQTVVNNLKGLALFVLVAVLSLLLAGLLTPARAQTGTRRVTLAWEDTANPAGTVYNAYRLPAACGTPEGGATTWVKLNATPVNVKTYQDNAVGIGTYCYRVTAVLNGLESEPSNTAGATVGPFAPGALTLRVTVTVVVNP